MGGVVLFESARELWADRDKQSRGEASRLRDADLVGVRVDGKVNVVKNRHGVARTVSEEQFAQMRREAERVGG